MPPKNNDNTHRSNYEYPIYEKWKVDIENMPKVEENDPKEKKRIKLTAVKIERDNVKIDHNEADMLNEQSHNNGTRYYKKGTVKNGDEEIITMRF